MTKDQIDNLQLPDTTTPTLVETHISWVLIGNQYAYKIKKPITYHFLDFSTLQKRRYLCEKEISLNKRLTEDIYLDVQPVIMHAGHYYIGQKEGDIIDFAVRMNKVDRTLQMDNLLAQNKVSTQHIQQLAEKIAAFHKSTTIIYEIDIAAIQRDFNDLGSESAFLNNSPIITTAIQTSNEFMIKHRPLLVQRLNEGLFRDCHGDLHTRNIFLLQSPQPFDCIEFNDHIRQIDVLNEVAFLCMDLDAAGRQDLSELFMKYYNELFPAMRTTEEKLLFIYYKCYRANVRAKVNSLRARSADNEKLKNECLAQADKYLKLMEVYLLKMKQNKD